MKDAKILDANEIKRILAKEFDVPVENIIKMQYSFAVVLDKEGKGGGESCQKQL